MKTKTAVKAGGGREAVISAVAVVVVVSTYQSA